TIATPTFVGGESPSPVIAINPLRACSKKSYPGASGSQSPNADIDPITSCGLIAHNDSLVTFSREACLGQKFSTTTSAHNTNSRNDSWPATDFKSRVVSFLPRLQERK